MKSKVVKRVPTIHGFHYMILSPFWTPIYRGFLRLLRKRGDPKSGFVRWEQEQKMDIKRCNWEATLIPPPNISIRRINIGPNTAKPLIVLFIPVSLPKTPKLLASSIPYVPLRWRCIDPMAKVPIAKSKWEKKDVGRADN